jgi:hypothetical protein
MLKKRIKNRTRDPSKRTNNASELVSITQEEWEKIDWLKVDRLIESMPKIIYVVFIYLMAFLIIIP